LSPTFFFVGRVCDAVLFVLLFFSPNSFCFSRPKSDQVLLSSLSAFPTSPTSG
jgi:hypothetical protein